VNVPAPSGQDLIPRLEFARRLGKGVRTLDKWASRGIFGVFLVSYQRGDRTYYRLADYQAWQRAVDRRRAAVRARAAPAKRDQARERDVAERLARHGL
jgi:phage terminase Nu1 subunit (DNA packaging protein)